MQKRKRVASLIRVVGTPRGKMGCVGSAEEIYADTDTSFEVSGAPLATAAKET